MMDKAGKPIETPAEWCGVHYSAIVSAVLNDLSSIAPETHDRPTPAYIRHLSDWLTSGNDIDIMYLTTRYGLDIWQYDDEAGE